MFSQPGTNAIALVAIVMATLVIVILAFFFTFPHSGTYGNKGLPYAEEPVRISFKDFPGRSDRLNYSTRTQAPQPQAVREDGLPAVAIPD